ncbi:hypothetical protein OG432_32310 [Streptomyces sp. NBC_00442]|uniref:hypothetical protein n=1 Tax=Streptomyces sp. NBC_00442 TaxID=2903651 RepID=UPI002E1E9475
MLTEIANEESRLSLWLRVREFAVPPSMIETATDRRSAGDWAGACAAAHVDVDLDLRSLARTHGRALSSQVRADLRRLAPDLLRWHMPRIAPDGLLRPGLTLTLARYGDGGAGDPESPVHLVVRTPPAWADAGQRISLALWHGPRADAPGAARHPRPRPHPRFRLDLHRHLWDATRTAELRTRAGTAGPGAPPSLGDPVLDARVATAVAPGRACAVGRWAAEAAIALRADGRSSGPVTVRLGLRERLALELAAGPDGTGPPVLRLAEPRAVTAAAPLVLPDAATWETPDAELLRAGRITADRLHPLVAAALVPEHTEPPPSRGRSGPGRVRFVECRGQQHRIGLLDGALSALDHDPVEVRREELLAALSGTPLPCLQAIDEAHRRPECLVGVRERLDHGDIAGALAVVEHLLGPEAVLRGGGLKDALEDAAQGRIAYGLYRSGLSGPAPDRLPPAFLYSDKRRSRPSDHRSRPRHAHTC